MFFSHSGVNLKFSCNDLGGWMGIVTVFPLSSIQQPADTQILAHSQTI